MGRRSVALGVARLESHLSRLSQTGRVFGAAGPVCRIRVAQLPEAIRCESLSKC